MSSDVWITASQYESMYGIGRATLYTWVKKGKIVSRKIGHKRYFKDPKHFENITAAPNEIKDIDRIPLLRGTEMAKVLGISTRRVRQLVEGGKLSCRTIYRNRRYSVQDLRDIIAYRASRESLPNGSKLRPKSLRAKQVREAILRFVQERLNQTS